MTLRQAEELLQKYYGHSSFRPGQRQIIESILAGYNTLGIMPTGGGKSICYQIPALMFPGITIVISPLISLMKDQVDGLRQLGIPATYINSSLTLTEMDERIREMTAGKYKLLYIAPERLESGRFRAIFETLPVYLVTIDEAHCISQWGHDFRPSYRSMAQMIRQLPRKPIIAALTATATPEVREDIASLLSIEPAHIYATRLQRDNLSFSVRHEEDRREFIRAYLEAHPRQTGIIYCSTRKEVDQLHQDLSGQGFATAAYHAGMSDEERERAQEKFSYDQLQAIVATNAFGMGIDKSNVRFVIHYNLPKNLESYYQEAGRAGRDGEESECILLYSPQDVHTQKFLIEQSELSPERKQHEFGKLQEMHNYCYTSQCLQATIVKYFGDPGSEPCGKCSNCRKLTEEEEIDLTTEAQKIFSCIKRMKERFGLSTVSKVLKGSKSKRILEWQLDGLSTYGIMKEYTEKQIHQLCLELVAEGYLHIRLNNHSLPVAKLTPKAIEVLKGERKVTGLRKIYKDGPKQSGQAGGLFEELRAVRLKLSQREQIPPYMIFPDSTLKEMCKRLPQNKEAMLLISGVGERKYQMYGEEFLAVIAQYVKQNGISPLVTHEAEPGQSEKEPSHLISYRLYQQGKSIADIAETRGLSTGTIEDHLFRCGVDGLPLDWNRFIPAEHEELIMQKIEELGAQKLRPIKDALPEEVTYMAIKAAIAKRQLLLSAKT
ncbi:DNA helicase RecQ [Lihuaxuella thermophila]|uniref:DNA helicase RecQ n=1 Tax=Lihuaxuella thermophila TaxID=1173111 RepID=A0A1H8H6N5_9BACL|nr:DNA helicase RecQ [Lihuaxuella thermophila]SEN51690.1 ATP-dependent DNA helicase RecQ [Lihuaxuella thermophila]